MRSAAIYIIIAIFFALSLGCTGSDSLLRKETALDKNWSRSFELQKYNQQLKPKGSENLAPVEGLDGGEAMDAKGKYDESFKQEKTQEIVNVLKLQ